MSTEAKSDTANELDERKKRVLQVIVNSYIADAAPVPSKVVARKSGLDVSGATIRNDMHVLEDEGYLTHMHTSSGRIPTDRGYRFFVDHFVSQAHTSRHVRSVKNEIETGIERARHDPDQLFDHIVLLLSSLTRHTAVLVNHSPSLARVSDLHVSNMGDGRCVVALFLDDSSIERCVVSAADVKGETDSFAQTLRKTLLGCTLEEIARHNNGGISDRMMRAFYDEYDRTRATRTEDSSVHIAGVAHIAQNATSDQERDAEISGHLLALMEEHMTLLDVVRSHVHEKIDATIGSENSREELSRHSMVLTPFETSTGEQGALGIIGPTRMDYAKVFSYLGCVTETMAHG